MHTEKLHKLADFLEREILNSCRVNMASWTDSCGTASCAIGWACEYKVFPELVWNIDKIPVIRHIVSEELKGYYAVEKLFELSAEEAIFLFSGSSYVSMLDIEAVIYRLKAFANGLSIKSICAEPQAAISRRWRDRKD